MSWKSDIEEWIDSWFEKGQAAANQFKKTADIAIRGGWNPIKYHPGMKKQLHKWLTEWYTLSVKKLSTPATRRNPIERQYAWPKYFIPEEYLDVQDFSD